MPTKRKPTAFRAEVPAEHYILRPEVRRRWYSLALVGGLPEEYLARLYDHYKKNPFNIIWDGCLFVISKKAGRVPFFPNKIQSRVLKAIEKAWKNNEMVRELPLKPRQVGLSTLGVAIVTVLTLSQSHFSANIVAHRKSTTTNMRRMIKNFLRYSAPGLFPKPSIDNADMIEFDDKEGGGGIEDCRILFQTAESRDKLVLGFTFQINLYTEVAFWPAQEDISGALDPTVPDEPHTLILRESTGNQVGDVFHAMYEAGKPGADGEREDGMDGLRSWFFPWYEFEEYQKPLKGVTEEEFRMALNERHTRMMRDFPITCEQINWYIMKENSMCAGGRMSLANFRRMYPTVDTESFFGGGTSFFDKDLLEEDTNRLAMIRLVKYDNLPESVNRLGSSGMARYARCSLFLDKANSYAKPEFRDDEEGDWMVFERARGDHLYGIAADIATGDQSNPGVADSKDYSVLDIGRMSMDQDEAEQCVQVAQFRSQTIDPRALAREAKAAAVIYGQLAGNEECCVIPEANGPGGVFIEQGKDDRMRFYMRDRGGKMWTEHTDLIGFWTGVGDSTGSRLGVITHMREVWKQRRILIMSPQTIAEMNVFVQNKRGKYEARKPWHDDTVLTMCFLIELMRSRLTVVFPVRASKTTPARTTPMELRYIPAPPAFKQHTERWDTKDEDSDYADAI